MEKKIEVKFKSRATSASQRIVTPSGAREGYQYRFFKGRFLIIKRQDDVDYFRASPQSFEEITPEPVEPVKTNSKKTKKVVRKKNG